MPPLSPRSGGGPPGLVGTLSPLPTLEDSLPPLLGLQPATRGRTPPGPPSEIRFIRWGEPTGLVPRGSGAEGVIRPHRDCNLIYCVYISQNIS